MRAAGEGAIAQQLPPRQPPDLPDDPGFRRRPPRRRIRTSGFRLRRDSGSICAKWGNRPETPLLTWKFDEAKGKDGSVEEEEKSTGGGGRRSGRSVRPPVVSSRKLAAGLWHLRSPEFQAGVGQRLGHQSGGGPLGANIHCLHVDRVHSASTKDPLVYTPRSMSSSIHGLFDEFQPPLQLPNSAMEGATKWDPDGWKASDEIKHIFGQSKPFDRRASTTRVISALEAELGQVRARINELEAERRSSRRKLEQFLQKLSEERAAWRSREHEKIRVIIDDIKSDLNREKKNRQRLEIVNSKLVSELADAKSAVKHYRQEFHKEKKAREMVEEICDELAKEIGGDEAELEAVKRESMKIREEMEEERRMLQMAEVWREERVQMKLVDAKAMLEEKYAQMNQIIEELESFLKLGRTSNPEVIKKAESIQQAAASINMQDVRELRYEPTNQDDIFSVFKDVNFGENNEREVEPPGGYSPPSHSSRIHTVTPDVAMVNKGNTYRNSIRSLDQSSDLEEDPSEWETVSRPEDQGSSYSPNGSDPSVKFYRASNVSRSRTQWDKNGGEEMPIMEISEVSSAKMRQLKRFLSASNGKYGKPPNTRLSNRSNMSQRHASANGGLSPRELSGDWSSHEMGNPHITRAPKGCIEWPLSAQKSSLKARLLEAKMENQKIQLRQVLKQKI